MAGDYSLEFELASEYAESAAWLVQQLQRFARKDEPDEVAKQLADFRGGILEESYRATIAAHRSQLDINEPGDLIECAGDVYSNGHSAAVDVARRVLLVVWNAVSPDGAWGAFFDPTQILDTSLISARSWPSVRRAILDFPPVHGGLLSAGIIDERNELLRRRMGVDPNTFLQLLQARQESKLPRVDLRLNKVSFAGREYEVSPDAALLLSELVKSYPDQIAASSFTSKPSRVRKSLPEELKSLIKTSPGKGYRLILPTY